MAVHLQAQGSASGCQGRAHGANVPGGVDGSGQGDDLERETGPSFASRPRWGLSPENKLGLPRGTMDDPRVEDMREFREERAAILEYEANMSRVEAEYLADVLTKEYMQRKHCDAP